MASSKGSGLKQPSKKAAKPAPKPAGPPPKWVVVQLTSLGEREKNIDIIVRAARQILGAAAEMFVPAVVQKVREESHTMVYMDGYVFVRHEEGVNYMKMQDTTYFKSVLCTPGSNGKRTYCLLDDFVLDGMRDGVKNMQVQTGFEIGQPVKVTKGQYKNLCGKVMLTYADGQKVQVHIPLSSKPVLIEFPPNFLEKHDPV